MARLLESEKAARYDALQVAIECNIKNYKRRAKEAGDRYREADVLGAYNKGLADAYRDAVEMLEKLTH